MEDILTRAIESLGYAGVALLMFLENIVPPIPSEVVMPAAGASARSGQLSLAGVIVAGTAGSFLGALPWYAVARYVGTDRFCHWADRHGNWIGLTQKDVRRADRWFDRYGRWAVVLGRLIPGIRTLISVPAGFSEMPLTSFMLCTAVGTAAWSTLLALLGYWLQGHKTVADVLQWIGAGVLLLLLILFVIRAVRQARRRD
jgi:membrane protein DedA with SNARE-associated domain